MTSIGPRANGQSTESPAIARRDNLSGLLEGPGQVTFRVTSRWQNPKTLVNGRKNPKDLEATFR